MTLRVLIAEDQALLRRGLARLLTEAGVEVVGTAESYGDALRQARERRPDAVLTDLRMPPNHDDEGMQIAGRLAEGPDPVGVLILSQYAEPARAMELLTRRTAGTGYLLKDRVADLRVLIDALERVAAGETVIDPALVTGMLARNRPDDPLAELTHREREVLGLMAEGRSNNGICARLHLSPRTVESHVRMIFVKLGLDQHPDDSRRVLAVLTWLRTTTP